MTVFLFGQKNYNFVRVKRMNIWPFHKKTRLEGEQIDLVIDHQVKASAFNDYVPSVIYDICLHGTSQKIGTCDLRIGMNERLYFAGNIGYRIYPEWRGNSYAYQACLILFEQAKNEYGMDRLLITCSPDNIPSKKTLEKLGGRHLDTVDVPPSHWLYERGETVKDIFEYRL